MLFSELAKLQNLCSLVVQKLITQNSLPLLYVQFFSQIICVICMKDSNFFNELRVIY